MSADIPETPPPAFTVPPALPAAADEALYAALLQADRSASLGPIVTGLSREFNELLTTLLGALSQLAAGADPAALARAERACLAASDVSRRLAALGRGDDSERRAVAPREIFEAAIARAAAGSAAELSIAIGEPVDAVWVEPGPMTQVFGNLIRNAAEAMHPSPPRPRVQLRAANVTLPEGQVAGLPAGDYVEFEVRDNGAGIAPENLEKIWEPFFTFKKHGSGLGLPTALAIVRRHGGQIGVDSVVGVGTVFTLFLPRAQRPETVGAQRAPSPRFRTGRILVLDDDADIRAVTGAMLENLDYKFDTAATGEDAVACYRRYLDVGRPYDAVIMDQNLVGGMGGEEAFRRLRALDPEVRAIATSGQVGEAFARHCLALGFSGWLAKPYRSAELGEALQGVLG